MKHFIRTLPVLILNPYSRCNCRCRMCEIWKRDTAREMTWEEFARQLPSIEALDVQWVVFSGGEPLMHSGLFRFCAELRQRGVRVTVLSSGLLLERHAEKIAENVDDLIVSLDGPPEIHNRIRGVPHAFEHLANGIACIRACRREYPITARCTVQRMNCARLADTVQSARSLGLNSISFLAADLHSIAFNRTSDLNLLPTRSEIALNAAEVDLLDAEIETLAGSGHCGRFIAESPEKLRRIAHHFRCYLDMASPMAPVCNAPWNSAVVEADGSVRPCFFHPPTATLTSDTDLQAALNGPDAMAFRNSLNVPENPVCRQCVCSLNWKGR